MAHTWPAQLKFQRGTKMPEEKKSLTKWYAVVFDSTWAQKLTDGEGKGAAE
jgi:hypothetical protein